MGKEGKYDLKLVEQPLASDTDSETESEDGVGGVEMVSQGHGGGDMTTTLATATRPDINQPAKIIKGNYIITMKTGKTFYGPKQSVFI